MSGGFGLEASAFGLKFYIFPKMRGPNCVTLNAAVFIMEPHKKDL